MIFLTPRPVSHIRYTVSMFVSSFFLPSFLSFLFFLLYLYKVMLAQPAVVIISNPYPVSGNGTPLQYSCLENTMDGGAWKAAVHGVAVVGHD